MQNAKTPTQQAHLTPPWIARRRYGYRSPHTATFNASTIKRTSSSVFSLSNEIRIVPFATSSGNPIAFSTCETCVFFESQAAPVETAMPRKSSICITPSASLPGKLTLNTPDCTAITSPRPHLKMLKYPTLGSSIVPITRPRSSNPFPNSQHVSGRSAQL